MQRSQLFSPTPHHHKIPLLEMHCYHICIFSASHLQQSQKNLLFAPSSIVISESYLLISFMQTPQPSVLSIINAQSHKCRMTYGLFFCKIGFDVLLFLIMWAMRDDNNNRSALCFMVVAVLGNSSHTRHYLESSLFLLGRLFHGNFFNWPRN